MKIKRIQRWEIRRQASDIQLKEMLWMDEVLEIMFTHVA